MIVGGGPAGLMAADYLGRHTDHRIAVYDQKPSVARKFLLAGRGGLNITHSEPMERFVARYGDKADFLGPALQNFTPADLIDWVNGLGISTFVGSSGRVFPVGMKASPLVRAWAQRLDAAGVQFHTRHKLAALPVAGEGNIASFVDRDGRTVEASYDALLLAMGGASYPHLGATGDWPQLLAGTEIARTPFRAINCGFERPWSGYLLQRFEGHPLKNVQLSFGGETARGDVILTGYGLEGGAVYGISRPLAAALADGGAASFTADLRPDIPREALAARLDGPRNKQSLSSLLRKRLHFSPLETALLRECAADGDFADPARLSAAIKALPVTVYGARPMARAISVSGGLCTHMLDDNFMIRQRPGWFSSGEMIDWDAPTGGYLLQACFSTAMTAARGIETWLTQLD
jgi:hypothetical protein